MDDPTTPEDESVIYSDIYNQGYEDAMKEISKKLFNNNNNNEGGNGVG